MRQAAIFLVLTALAIFATPAQAVEISSKEQVVAMVHRVQEKFKNDGLEAAVAAVNDKSTPEFHDRDLYPFIYDMQGICLANGARPAVVGRNLISLKDQDGKYLIQEMVAIASGPGIGCGPGRPARMIAAAVSWVRRKLLVTQTALLGNCSASPVNNGVSEQSQDRSVWP